MIAASYVPGAWAEVASAAGPSTGHHHTLEHGHHVCSGGLLPGEGHHELPSSGRTPECVDSAVPSTPGVAAPSRVDSIDNVDSVDSIPPAVSC